MEIEKTESRFAAPLGCLGSLAMVYLVVRLIIYLLPRNPDYFNATYHAPQGADVIVTGALGSVSHACTAFNRRLRNLGDVSNVVKSVACGGRDGGPYEIEVVVRSTAWEVHTPDERLDFAGSLWNAFVAGADPKHPDMCLIRLMNEQGDYLGGSGSVGSLIQLTGK